MLLNPSPIKLRLRADLRTSLNLLVRYNLGEELR